MISLITPDNLMVSHRNTFKILDHPNKDFFYSEHIPFSNDENTSIKTILIPLNNGWHCRIHKINLSQRYIIKEGGFSLPFNNDNRYSTYDGSTFELISEKYKSIMTCKATIHMSFTKDFSQPGFHFLSPLSMYPYAISDVLEKGTYYVASAHNFIMQDETTSIPILSINNNDFSIKFEGSESSYNLYELF